MNMPYLPPELISDILLRLPVKGLVRFSSVSKLRHGVIRSKDFIKEHHQRAINSNKDCILLSRVDDQFDSLALSTGTLNADKQPIKHPFYSVEERKRLSLRSRMVASCNGLILVEVATQRHCLTMGKRYLFLWNPMIAKHRKIPYEASKLAPGLTQSYGLGYHYDDDDLKVLTLTKSSGPNLSTELKIYSLASDTWKRVEKIPPRNLALPANYEKNMVSLNSSCVAWVMRDENEGTRFIVTFDLVKEEYHSLPIPDYPGQLIVLGGFFFFYHYAHVFTNVWIMNKDSNSWTMKLYVTVKEYCEPLFFDGERFLFRKYGDQNLFWYSTKTQEYATTHHQYTPGYFCTYTIFCVGNLRLLLDGDPDGMDTFGDH